MLRLYNSLLLRREWSEKQHRKNDKLTSNTSPSCFFFIFIQHLLSHMWELQNVFQTKIKFSSNFSRRRSRCGLEKFGVWKIRNRFYAFSNTCTRPSALQKLQCGLSSGFRLFSSLLDSISYHKIAVRSGEIKGAAERYFHTQKFSAAFDCESRLRFTTILSFL